MASEKRDLYFVFMNYDPEFDRLRSNRWRRYDLDMYLCKKHDELLANMLDSATYNRTLSFAIVDAFAVQITSHQANVLRSAKSVRLVEKNQELLDDQFN